MGTVSAIAAARAVPLSRRRKKSSRGQRAMAMGISQAQKCIIQSNFSGFCGCMELAGQWVSFL